MNVPCFRLISEFVTTENEVSNSHISSTWVYPNFLYVLTKTGGLFKNDFDKKTTTKVSIGEKLSKFLVAPIKTTTFIKATFEGLLIVFPKHVVLIRTEPSAVILNKVELAKPVLNLHDFHTSFRFIGWTPRGNILQIQVTDTEVNQQLVWERSEKKQFLAAAFIQPDENHFATIDQDRILQIHSIQTKEENWRQKLPMECKTLTSHPKFPIVFVLTSDGRVIVFAIMIKVTMPPQGKCLHRFCPYSETEITRLF